MTLEEFFAHPSFVREMRRMTTIGVEAKIVGNQVTLSRGIALIPHETVDLFAQRLLELARMAGVSIVVVRE